MQLTAYHDDNGNVVVLIARPDDAPPSHIELRPGLQATEIRAPELTADLDAEQLRERLSELRNRRVERSGDGARLVETS